MVFIPNMSKSKKQAEHSQQAEAEGVADTYDKLGIRPHVVRVSAKKKKGTSVVNFTDICRLLRRQPKHLLTFLSVELGTSGSIDGSNKLVFKGKLLQQKHVERALRRYVRDYVECRACLSPNTVLQKDDATLDFLQCEACPARCLVASIKPVLSQTIAIKNYYMALGSNVRSVDPNVTKKRKRKGQARRWIFLYTLYLYLHCIYCGVVLCFGLESAIPRLV